MFGGPCEIGNRRPVLERYLCFGIYGFGFFGWLNERFERRNPPQELASVADAHLSVVFTSSFGPVLKNLFGTDGREPKLIPTGDPPPPVSRSKLRPRIFYFFGMTRAGKFQPPTNRHALSARRSQHATPMLNTLFDVATPLGVIVVDGLRAGNDWLSPSEILGQLSRAPTESVLWFGPNPGFKEEDEKIFAELIKARGIAQGRAPSGNCGGGGCARYREATDLERAWHRFVRGWSKVGHNAEHAVKHRGVGLHY